MDNLKNLFNWNKFIDYYCSTNDTNLLFNAEILPTTKVVSFEDNIFLVSTTDKKNIELLNQNKENIKKAINDWFHVDVDLHFICENSYNIREQNNTNMIDVEDETNPQFNFTNYVVGTFNRNAVKLANEVVNKANCEYNPIFIYSKTGLGKTHLMNAVANEFRQRWPNKKLHYINAQTFLKKLYNIFENKNQNSNLIQEFKDVYSSYDVLLIDDVQYLAHKNKTNEILFTIFNTLTLRKKIVILSSDRAPNELNGFEDRMISRFNSGITCRINEPEDESLIKIINNTLNNKGINLTDDATSLVTNTFNRDIRELIGVLNKIIFLNKHDNENNTKTLDFNEVRDVLEVDNYVIGSKRKISAIRPNQIIDQVAKIYDIKSNDIVGNSRKKQIVIARHICMYIMREYGKLQLSDIGFHLGNRDHTTVLNGVEKIKSQVLKDKDFNALVNNIVKKITNW